MEDLERRAQELAEQEQKEQVQEQTSEKALVTSNPNYEVQVANNKFVNAMTDNDVAVQMAREEYNSIKNQKSIAKDIKKVAIDNTRTDIDSANIQVEEKKKNNKVKRQEINNELYRLKKEREFLEKEQKHRLEMQRAEQIREKYEDLLLRTCRKKQKGEDGKMHYINDENGKPIVNIPGRFKLFWLKLFDGLISTLNQTADIFGALNKNVLKGGFIILLILLVFVPPFRNWLISLIGIKL